MEKFNDLKLVTNFVYFFAVGKNFTIFKNSLNCFWGIWKIISLLIISSSYLLISSRLLSSDSYLCDESLISYCSVACPITYNPYCGTDGKTYRNRCELARAWCRSSVTIAYCGTCSKFLALSLQAAVCRCFLKIEVLPLGKQKNSCVGVSF